MGYRSFSDRPLAGMLNGPGQIGLPGIPAMFPQFSLSAIQSR
jgi:hypothetical protein